MGRVTSLRVPPQTDPTKIPQFPNPCSNISIHCNYILFMSQASLTVSDLYSFSVDATALWRICTRLSCPSTHIQRSSQITCIRTHRSVSICIARLGRENRRRACTHFGEAKGTGQETARNGCKDEDGKGVSRIPIGRAYSKADADPERIMLACTKGKRPPASSQPER